MEVDLIIKSKWIAPVIPKATLLEDYAVIVKDKKIVGLCSQKELKTQYIAENTVYLSNHILIPGLVNSHGHAAMALLRGVADDLPLNEWLENRIWPIEKGIVNRDFVLEGTNLAIAEMIASGTTCFADMYFFPDEVAKAAISANIRVQTASPILDFPTIWADNADEYILKATKIHDQYRNHELVYTAFGPHAPYSVSDDPLKKIRVLADELDIPIHMHIHETKKEIEDSIAEFGCRPFERLHNLGLITPRLNSIHSTQLLSNEISTMGTLGTNVTHCPSSNMKLASGFCDANSLIHQGVNVALGTDGAASNNNLNMFNEIRTAALLAKVVSDDASALPAYQALEMATINGAKALGIEELIGSLEPEKFADITAVSLNEYNTLPVNNALSHLVYAANSNQVTHVWVSGENIYNEGVLTTMNKKKILDSAVKWQDRISKELAS